MTVPVPFWLPEAVVRRPLIDVAPSRALVRFPGVGRILVCRDGVIVRCPDPGCDLHELEFLDDVVDALACLYDGTFPLRASAVEVDGGAVLLCAQMPAGKSTIAAALGARGHRFLTDSLAVVTVADGVPEVHGPTRGPVLFPDAIERVGFDAAHGRPVRRGIPARRFEGSGAPWCLPLRAVVRLVPDHIDAEPPAPGFSTVTELVAACWHRFAIEPLGLVPRQFEWAVAVARAVPMHALDVPPRADPFAMADAVLELSERGTAR